MPIFLSAKQLIRSNLTMIAAGDKAPMQEIGCLTATQHQAINNARIKMSLPPLGQPEIVYIGHHHYQSRQRDGYSIEDMVAQIISALDATAVVLANPRMTALESSTLRNDGYGNRVCDRAIFELTQRKPRAELFSVIPKGDQFKPRS